MKLYLILAWRNIWRNKTRSIISITSILFAVLIAIATRTLQLGTYSHMINNAVSFFTGYIQIHAPGYWDKKSLEQSFQLDGDILADIQRLKYVTSIAPRLESFALVSGGEITEGAMIIGIDPEKENQLTGLKKRLALGNYLSSFSEGVLLSQGLAEHLKLAVGDTVVLLGQGFQGVTAAAKLRIDGLLSFPTPDLNNGLVYLTLGNSQDLFLMENRITSLAIMIKGQKQLPKVMQELEVRFVRDYEIMSWKDMLPELVQYIEVDNASGIIILLIIYMVIGFGILGTILMMTLEHNREFGMLIAIGMKRSRMSVIVVLESLIISFVGVILGIIVSIPVIVYFYFNPIKLTGDMAQFMLKYGFEPIMPFSLDPAIFLMQAFTVLIIALFVSLYPLFRIARIKPVQALKTI